MSGNGEQLVSFFLYSLFIYPVTNYIVSPQRKYPRWRAALYAIAFLLAVSTLHMWYDNMEAGPNFYQILHVDRNTPISIIKKSYRSLSLEYHPDKNRDPAAVEIFTKVKHAFDVITDKEKRREYNRLGEHGVAVLAQSVVDYKYIILQLIVYYVSSAIFAFLMTFSEPTGDAFQICLFGLSVMLLVEMLLVVQEVELPSWFLPSVTPNEIIVVLHRLFPAFMNGCRCITGAFYVDTKAVRVAALEAVANSSKDLSMRISSISRALLARSEAVNQGLEDLDEDSADELGEKECEDEELENLDNESGAVVVEVANEVNDEIDVANEPSSETVFPGVRANPPTAVRNRQVKLQSKSNTRNSTAPAVGIMEKGLMEVRRRVAHSIEGRSGQIGAFMAEKIRLISDPKALRDHNNSANKYSPGLILLRDVGIYLLARFLLVKGKGL